MQAGDEEKLRMGTGKDKKEIIVEQYSSQDLFRCNHNTVEHWGLEFVVQWKFRGLEEDLVSKSEVLVASLLGSVSVFQGRKMPLLCERQIKLF